MVRSFMIALFVLSFAAAGSFAGEAVNAVDIAQHMNKGKYSSAEIKSYLKELKGKQVSAHGKVDDIMTGKSGTRVVLQVTVPGKSAHFVVDVYVKDAGNLHRGDKVSCTGEYTKYNMLTLNGIAIKGSCSK